MSLLASALRTTLALIAAGLLLQAAPAQAASPGASALSVEQPRSFGHVIGDVLTQRVLLDDGEQRLEPTALPSADRVGLWFERRAPRIEADNQGRRWLVIDYQLVNAPRGLVAVTLPGLTLATRSGTSLKLEPWPVSIGPLTPDSVFAQGELQTMQADRPAAELPTAAVRTRFIACLAALAVVCVSWLAWVFWRNWRDSVRLPFARAWHQMRRLERAGADGSAEAWLAMHRALNSAAGRVVHAGSLQRLFSQAPQLEPLRPQLEDFYLRSGERFFAREPSAAPFPLMALCRELRRIEKQTRR